MFLSTGTNSEMYTEIFNVLNEVYLKIDYQAQYNFNLLKIIIRLNQF